MIFLLFLPFKKKADATGKYITELAFRCFYLSKRRQMQQLKVVTSSKKVVFTFQKEGRCNKLQSNLILG